MEVEGEGSRYKTVRGEGGKHVAVQGDRRMEVQEGGCSSRLASEISVRGVEVNGELG